ncbi:hypothetical protein C1646_713806, partial [Rhizophagus diaphanus]
MTMNLHIVFLGLLVLAVFGLGHMELIPFPMVHIILMIILDYFIIYLKMNLVLSQKL